MNVAARLYALLIGRVQQPAAHPSADVVTATEELKSSTRRLDEATARLGEALAELERAMQERDDDRQDPC